MHKSLLHFGCATIENPISSNNFCLKSDKINFQTNKNCIIFSLWIVDIFMLFKFNMLFFSRSLNGGGKICFKNSTSPTVLYYSRWDPQSGFHKWPHPHLLSEDLFLSLEARCASCQILNHSGMHDEPYTNPRGWKWWIYIFKIHFLFSHIFSFKIPCFYRKGIL